MGDSSSVYLDNAATSWPKPDGVIDAIARYYRDFGCAAGRGATRRSQEVNRTIDRCRLEIARLVGGKAANVVFCFNGTDGLNMAIAGMVRPGDHVLTSDLEHNSILRPLNSMQQAGSIKYDVVPSEMGWIDPARFASMVGTNTKLICISHVSNVTGMRQDVAEIIAACRAKNGSIFVLLDAAQSVGHIPVDIRSLECDLLVASGHKGLLGPLGTGLVCLSDRARDEIRPVRFGGTGSQSDSIVQPEEMPFRLEAGNLNAGGIFGLLDGIQFVSRTGVEKVAAHEKAMSDHLIRGLQKRDNVQIYGWDEERATSLVSFNIRNHDPQSVAGLLDAEFGIQVRAGYHCAPLMHQALGTDSCGGTLRASPGIFSTVQDLDRLIDAVEQLSSQLV